MNVLTLVIWGLIWHVVNRSFSEGGYPTRTKPPFTPMLSVGNTILARPCVLLGLRGHQAPGDSTPLHPTTDRCLSRCFRLTPLSFHARFWLYCSRNVPALASLGRGVLQVLVVNDIVSVEDAGRQMAAQSHGRVLRDTRPHHVPDGTPSHVVHGPPLQPSPPAGVKTEARSSCRGALTGRLPKTCRDAYSVRLPEGRGLPR